MMKLIVYIYEASDTLINKGIPMSKIKEIGFFETYPKIKNEVANIEMAKIDEMEEQYLDSLDKIAEEYKEVL